jgi:hypothetical protein
VVKEFGQKFEKNLLLLHCWGRERSTIHKIKEEV